MSKIMLVEDDNNLREIYEARLLAEGYEIVAAHDGEEALALAVKEKPDLIISDVMMPKISGFDMLDILRSTPETKYTKVIMMTALSQAEDKSRADKLGADRYLVKSQVTLEDVAKIAREVLEGESGGNIPATVVAPVANAPIAAAPPTVSTPDPNPVPAPASVVAEPAAVPPVPDPITPLVSTLDGVQNAQTVSTEKAAVEAQVYDFEVTAVAPSPSIQPVPAPAPAVVEPVAAPPAPDPVATPAPDVIEPAPEETSSSNPAAPASPAVDMPTNVNGKKVLQPINDPAAKPDLNKLLEEEEKKNVMMDPIVISPTSSPAAAVTPAGEDPNLIAL
ncbi:hypothetical protein BH10PAT3_BH10PAT3_3140 [soil metagenome]